MNEQNDFDRLMALHMDYCELIRSIDVRLRGDDPIAAGDAMNDLRELSKLSVEFYRSDFAQEWAKTH